MRPIAYKGIQLYMFIRLFPHTFPFSFIFFLQIQWELECSKHAQNYSKIYLSVQEYDIERIK